MNPETRRLVGFIGGHTTMGRHDSRAIAQRAREGFLRRFMLEADPEGVLPEVEREQRARHLLAAHMRRLALRSARARRKAITNGNLERVPAVAGGARNTSVTRE